MQSSLGWYILVVQSAKLASQYCADTLSVKYSHLCNVFVAVSTIAGWTSSSGGAGLLQTKCLVAFDVNAILVFRTSISSYVIACHLPFLCICWPHFFIVVNMSRKGVKRFYDDYSGCHFVLFDCAAILPDPDHWCSSLMQESSTSTYADQARKPRDNRVTVLNDSVVTRLRCNFEYPPLKDRSVTCKDRGWATKYMVWLSQERSRDHSDTKCVKRRGFWFSIAQA